jgi:uncharacterized membrane protein YkgB
MNEARKVVFHSVRQGERQKQSHYQKDLPIIIVLIILFGILSVLMGLWQAPVPILIGIMSRLRTLFVFGFLAFAPSKECGRCLLTKFGLA